MLCGQGGPVLVSWKFAVSWNNNSEGCCLCQSIKLSEQETYQRERWYITTGLRKQNLTTGEHGRDLLVCFFAMNFDFCVWSVRKLRRPKLELAACTCCAKWPSAKCPNCGGIFMGMQLDSWLCVWAWAVK